MKARATTPLRDHTLFQLLAVLGLVVLPHATHLPFWLTGLVFSLGAWRFVAARQGLRLPAAWIRVPLTLLTLSAVFAHYGTLLGRDSGAALLIAMLGLKLLEVRETRDVYVVAFLGYFLIIIHFLFTQSIPMVVYMLVIVTLLTAVLIDLNRDRTTPLPVNLRLAGSLVAYALPLTLVLFILFPRINGPLWGMPNDAYSGLTGLSEQMAPGRISQLSLSDAVAFRASFENQLPSPQQRYWRGPVFTHTDGEGWRGERHWNPAYSAQAPSYRYFGEPFHYSVMVEPHNRPWLFALDLPARVPPASRITGDFQLLADQPLRERRRYDMISYPDYRTGPLSEEERHLNLQLPAAGNPRARALAAAWRRDTRSPAEIVQAALRMYREQDFVYTLSPPLVREEFVDGFLFTTRKGFCEHYAGSFAFLMRAAGIPARVVTGYQGGELNDLGNYLIVRQRDAHAWTEVWLEGLGWSRIDPTAAVAPERIERGIVPGLRQEGEAVRFESAHGPFFNQVWRNLRHGWDALNTRWNQWVLGFDIQRQTQLLSWLSLAGFSWQAVATALMTLIGAVLGLLVLRRLNAERRADDPVVRLYRHYCEKLARRGLPRAADEGPDDYAQRIIHARPDLARQVRSINALYVALRYGGHDPRIALTRLRREVRTFRP